MDVPELLTLVLAAAPSVHTLLTHVDRTKLRKDDLLVLLAARHYEQMEDLKGLQTRSLEILRVLQDRRP